MNPRIFKKFTKAAAVEIERLGFNRLQERVEAVKNKIDPPEVTLQYKWERKSLERLPNGLFGSPLLLSGTIGYGGVSGYYEPEWNDEDALSSLTKHVFDTFTDWTIITDGPELPPNNTPKRLVSSPRHLLAHVRQLNAGG